MKVGLTEKHGMALEQSQFPPQGVVYRFVEYERKGSKLFRSPIKGYFSRYNDQDVDLIESILSPIFTKRPWVYSLACYQEALAFNFLGISLPRKIRALIMRQIFLANNFKKLIFWSKAGFNTLESYGGETDTRIKDKSTVVYPGVRKVDKGLVRYKDKDLTLLFSGDFFRKGGVNVIDVFETVQNEWPDLTLYLCCDEAIDFNTEDIALRTRYLSKIKNNQNIVFGRVDRATMLNKILPLTDIFLLPTYNEAFGYSVLEAMAFGIPVITTNIMAMPEMIAQGASGYMINLDDYDCDQLFSGYSVSQIPHEFNAHITKNLSHYLSELLESLDLRKELGLNGREIAIEKFSFSNRALQMQTIYHGIN